MSLQAWGDARPSVHTEATIGAKLLMVDVLAAQYESQEQEYTMFSGSGGLVLTSGTRKAPQTLRYAEPRTEHHTGQVIPGFEVLVHSLCRADTTPLLACAGCRR